MVVAYDDLCGAVASYGILCWYCYCVVIVSCYAQQCVTCIQLDEDRINKFNVINVYSSNFVSKICILIRN